MRKMFAQFSTKALIAGGILALGFQLPASAADLNLTLSPNLLAGSARQSATLTIQVDAVADGSGDAIGVTIHFDVPKGLSVSLPSNCTEIKSKGNSSVVCALGDIAEGLSQTVDIDFSANKAGGWGVDVLAGCSASFCLGSMQQGLWITFSH